jgi:calcium/calmodulin-dependent protein kinase (CaM kinase) II
MGDVAVVCYTRLIQKVAADGNPVTVASTETRVWQKTPAGWKHVHFHRTGL